MAKAVSPVRATLLPPTYRKQMVGVMTRRALREIRCGETQSYGELARRTVTDGRLET